MQLTIDLSFCAGRHVADEISIDVQNLRIARGVWCVKDL